MNTRVLITSFFLIIGLQTFGQTLGEFKPKDQSYGLDKIRKAKADRIYIVGFNVNFQVYNEKQDYKQGGSMLGGGQRGDAQTEVSVGLEGLDAKTVQEITDKLYKDYTARLEAGGLSIISADEASIIDSYSDFERMKGGKISMAQIPGVMTSSPTGYEYFIKGVKKDGKEKKGGFLGSPAMMYPKLSKELGDAIIGEVDITVLFLQDQDAFAGNGAKIKVKTNLRLIATEGVTMTKDAKIKMKGQNSVTTVTSTVAFYHGKVGAGATSMYSGTLGKPLLIDGVIDSEKVTSYARGGTSQGSSTIYGTFYSVRNENTKNAKVIDVDSAKYSQGVYGAASKFLTHHTDAFLKEIE
jgi:hypothetical protein